MSRVKGRGNRKWTAQEKLDIVRRYLESGVERHRFASAEGIASGMLYTWVKRYQEQGEKGLKNKKKTGNP